MFGQHLWTINIIYIAFGIIIVAYAAIILADNVRPQSGAFYVYNPLGHSQPNKLRKLYWYSMGQPILAPRKQRMASFQMKQRYQNIPIKITSTFTNPVRNTYRNAYDASISASALKSYMNSVSLPTTALPKNSPRFQPSNPYDEPTYEDNKSCVEKNITMAAQDSGITVAQHLRPVQITSVPYNIPPITPLPIVPYVSHTYFTLDDVVIPSSSENLLYYKPEEKQIIPEVTPPPLTTQRSKSAESPLIDIFNIFGIEPEEKPIIEEKPQELVRDSEITTTSWMPVTMNIIKNETKMDIKPFKPMSLSQTMVENVLNIVTNHKNSTLMPEIETVANSSKELCKDCLKDEILTTLSPILNEIEDKKIEKPIEKNPVKNMKEIDNQSNSLSSLKTLTSTTFIGLLTSKLKIAQNHKKFSPISLKKYSTTTAPPVSSTTKAALRKSRRTKNYSRQRKVDANLTRLNNYNLTNAKSTYSKILRPTLKVNLKDIDKDKIQTVNVTDTTSYSTSTQAPVRNTPKTVRNTPAPRMMSTSTTSESPPLSAESAIMTISNANGRHLRGSMPTFRKRLAETHKRFAPTTDMPQLPIELYFNKLSKTQ